MTEPSTTHDEDVSPAPLSEVREPRLPRDVPLAASMGLLAAVPRVLTATADFIVADEPRWLYRSEAFSDALLSGRLSDASATSFTDSSGQATMPGVVTMWIGSAARGLWAAGDRLGLVPENEGSSPGFAHSAFGLKIAQALVALVTAALVGLLVLLVARWVGRTAAAVTGVLLASEPFFVANGAVLHTDLLYTLFGVASLVALALVLGLPGRTDWTDRRWVGLLAGVLFGLSWLTKVSAFMFVPGVVLLLGWAYVRARRSGPSSRALVAALRWWAGAAVAVVLVGYPALWANPASELGDIWTSVSLVSDEHSNFFLGETTTTPGPSFYLVALPLRMTPWFLVGFVLAVGAVLWRWGPLGRSISKGGVRAYVVVALLLAAPSFFILSMASKQFDRYGLPLLVLAAIVVGIVAESLVSAEGLGRSRPQLASESPSRRVAVLAGSATVAVVAHAVAVAPLGMSYFNPLLGGSRTAEDALLMGLGEGLDEAFALVEEDAPDGCRATEVRVQGWLMTPELWACDDVTAEGDDADYVVLYITHNQRAEAAELEELREGRELLGTVEVRGVTYAEVYGPPTA